MQKIALRILSGFLAMIALSLAVVPVQAVESDYVSEDSFWNWVAGDSDIAKGILSYLPIGSKRYVCSKSEDGYHHSNGVQNIGKNEGQTYVECVCKFCGTVFLGHASDLSAAYDDYVQTLPAPGYSSSNELRWRLNSNKIEPHSANIASSSVGSSFSVAYVSTYNSSDAPVFIYFDAFIAPISGDYRLAEYFTSSYESPRKGFEGGTRSYLLSSNRYYLSSYASKSDRYLFGQYYEFPDVHGFMLGQEVVGDSYTYVYGRSNVIEYAGGYVEVICKPAVSVSGDTYNINTRPTSITGGALGIADVDANGQLTGSYTKIDDHSSIVNETNNTYWNPVTNTTSSISNWSYDYSDRSYRVDYTTTNTTGDTVTNTSTITYGDEYITITEIDNSQGDTITNNYTIYYLIDGSGSGNPSCEHDWQASDATPPTCTRPGSAAYVCSKCQQTKTETLPALGHNWQVKRTVTTQYDDTGQLVQQGYTIFECSLCHEQYKSTDGTIPPGGGSGTDPGGEEESGGFLSWLFGKIGELLGTIGNGILNLLQTALDKIFGGLIDLVNSLFENLAKLVDLFGSVGEAFQVLWTWLPPEIIAILVAGVSIFVFVALIKFFMK